MARGQFIPDDSTIADVAPTLRNPEEFVRRVLENLHGCKREHGAAAIRIGVVGRGIAPNYLIEYADEPFSNVGAFNGRSHKLFIDEDALKPNWSRRKTPLEEVAVLLGALRDAKKRSI